MLTRPRKHYASLTGPGMPRCPKTGPTQEKNIAIVRLGYRSTTLELETVRGDSKIASMLRGTNGHVSGTAVQPKRRQRLISHQ